MFEPNNQYFSFFCFGCLMSYSPCVLTQTSQEQKTTFIHDIYIHEYIIEGQCIILTDLMSMLFFSRPALYVQKPLVGIPFAFLRRGVKKSPPNSFTIAAEGNIPADRQLHVLFPNCGICLFIRLFIKWMKKDKLFDLSMQRREKL